MESRWRWYSGSYSAWISGSATISASCRRCIQPMIFCTISEPLAASITSVSFMAGAPSSTAVRASGYCAPSMIRPSAPGLSRSGALKPQRFARHLGDKRRARLVSGVVELAPAGIPPEVLGVLRRQKRALVMVEPPGEPRIARVLEIDNGVLVAIEQAGVEQLGRLVRHSRVSELRIRVNRARDKAAEEGGRGGAVETMIVIQHAFQH